MAVWLGGEILNPLSGFPRDDLSLTFEHTILTLWPMALLIAGSPVYLYFVSRKPICIRRNALLWWKLGAVSALFGVEFANLIHHQANETLRSDTALAASAVSCVAAVHLSVIIYAEHLHNIRPSGLLAVFITLSLSFDVAKSRSYFYSHELRAAGFLAASASAAKLALLALAEIPKTSLILNEGLRKSAGAEATSGFWSRALFTWLNTTLFFGFKNLIAINDLPMIGQALSSKSLSLRFNEAWINGSTISENYLAKASSRALSYHFLIIALPRLSYSGFTFAQPYLLQRVIVFIGGDDAHELTQRYIIIAFLTVFTGKALSKASYMHLNSRLYTALRGILVSQIYKKTLLINKIEASKSTAVTLTNTDIEGMATGVEKLTEMWVGIIETLAGVYALSRVIDRASLSVALPAILSALLGLWLGRRTGPALAAWNNKVEMRVSKMSDILSKIKPLRMMGLAPKAVEYIQSLRVVEMEYSKKYRFLTTITMAALQFTDVITPVTVVGAAVLWSKLANNFTPDNVYPTLAVIAIIQKPLLMLLSAWPNIGAMMACFRRIQDYLLLEEWQDPRQIGAITDVVALLEEREICPGEEDIFTQIDLTDYVVQLSEASIAPIGTSRPVLQPINISLRRSTLTAVLGNVGAGKTTLLKAVLGETNLISGQILVEESIIAYCDQVAWLQNLSIRDNIVGKHQFDLDWYNKVVEACLLKEDFEQLPNGDRSLAGSEGISLSGGQRIRIELARALYCRASIFVADDVFSALDRRTAISVLLRVFGKDGLLRQSRTTVIFATHLAESLDLVDQLVVIKGDGHILSTESFSEGKYRHKLVRSLRNCEKEGRVSKPKDLLDVKPIPLPSQSADGRPKARIETHQKGDSSLYWYYFNSMPKYLLPLWIGCVFLVCLGEKMPEIYVRIWLDFYRYDSMYYFGYAMIAFGDTLATVAMHVLLYLYMVPNNSEHFHKLLLDTVQRSTLSFLTVTESGTILNKFSQDMTMLTQKLPSSMLKFFYVAFNLLIHTAMVFSGASYIALLAPAFLGCAYAVQFFYLRTSRQVRHLDLEGKTPLYTQFKDIANGLIHIRSFGDGSAWLWSFLSVVMELLCLGIALAIVTVAVFRKDSTSQSAIGLSLLSLISYGQLLTVFFEVSTQLEMSMGALTRIRGFFETTPVEDTVGETNLAANWPARGEIEFQNVTASYRANNMLFPVLRDVSLSIEAGKTVGLIGRTGSGKSSLFLTLLNFLEFTGSITIDGVDIRTVDRQELRSRITTVTQDFVSVEGSVRLNLLPFTGHDSTINETTILQVLSKLGIRGHIDAAGGIDSSMSNLGLSTGQRQLFAIARAILHHKEKRTKTILMDEVTSNMDVESDKKVQLAMKDAFVGCTVLVIAHQYEAFRHADFVIELSEGRIIGSGNVPQR